MASPPPVAGLRTYHLQRALGVDEELLEANELAGKADLPAAEKNAATTSLDELLSHLDDLRMEHPSMRAEAAKSQRKAINELHLRSDIIDRWNIAESRIAQLTEENHNLHTRLAHSEQQVQSLISDLRLSAENYMQLHAHFQQREDSWVAWAGVPMVHWTDVEAQARENAQFAKNIRLEIVRNLGKDRTPIEMEPLRKTERELKALYFTVEELMAERMKLLFEGKSLSPVQLAIQRADALAQARGAEEVRVEHGGQVVKWHCEGDLDESGPDDGSGETTQGGGVLVLPFEGFDDDGDLEGSKSIEGFDETTEGVDGQ